MAWSENSLGTEAAGVSNRRCLQAEVATHSRLLSATRFTRSCLPWNAIPPFLAALHRRSATEHAISGRELGAAPQAGYYELRRIW